MTPMATALLPATAVRRHDRLDVTAILVLVLLCALWGVQQAAVKIAVAGGLPPLLQAAMRSTVAAACVFAWVAGRDGIATARAMLRADRVLLPGIAIATLFGLEFLALFPGLRLTTASRGVVFLYTAPFFTALGAHLFLPDEKLRPIQAFGLLVAFAGVATTFADGLLRGGGSLLGDSLCGVAAVLWGATTVVVKASPALSTERPARVLFLQLFGSAPLLIAAAAVSGELWRWPDATGVAWLGLFYQTVIVAFASYLAWFWLVLAYPAARIAAFTFLTPLFGILAGTVLLGEHAGLSVAVGLVAIAVGLRLLNGRRRHAEPP
jgi:drug/metabolite transporter (DMT)-like permease